MRKRKLAIVLCALLVMAGCAHKTGAPMTPWERVMVDNTLLAQFVDTAEQGTELAVTSAALSTDTARPIITFESNFTGVHKQLTAILAQGPHADLSQAKVLLEQFKTGALALIASGEIGVKNPKTQMSISADIRNAIALAEAVLSDIQLVQSGGVK